MQERAYAKRGEQYLLIKSPPVLGKSRADVVDGQIAYVAEIRQGATTRHGRDYPRLRVIFSNHTESNLLLRSLSRSLYPDGDMPVGRRLIKKDDGPLFSNTVETDDIETGRQQCAAKPVQASVRRRASRLDSQNWSHWRKVVNPRCRREERCNLPADRCEHRG
jgi:hypothetical protein